MKHNRKSVPVNIKNTRWSVYQKYLMATLFEETQNGNFKGGPMGMPGIPFREVREKVERRMVDDGWLNMEALYWNRNSIKASHSRARKILEDNGLLVRGKFGGGVTYTLLLTEEGIKEIVRRLTLRTEHK